MYKSVAGVIGAVVALGLNATGAGAATVSPYSSFMIFGDSLSDNGNLFAATGGGVPASPPYFNGRFSNGPVWAEAVMAEFAATARATANFAFGGAQAINDADAIPDLQAQIGLFAANFPKAALGDRPLASLWFGANDLFAAIDTLPLGEVEAVGRSAAEAVADGVMTLSMSAGIGDFLIFNLPDFGALPAYALFDPSHAATASAGSAAFNAALDLQADLLRANGVNVIEIDMAGLFQDLLADPTLFGVQNATLPCVIPGVSVCSATEAEALAFFDPVHPTAKIHDAISGVVTTALAPVPLPAPALLLMAALAGFGIAGLRRRG